MCFMLAAFIDAFGSGIFSPFSLLYFKVMVGLPLPSIGLALSIATMATLVVIPITGILVDHVGAKRVVIIAQILQGLGFAGYLIVSNFVMLLGFALLVMIGQSMFWSAYFTLVADVARAGERDRWYGLVSAVRISGVGLGGLLAGIIVAVIANNVYHLVVIVNALSFFLAAALVFFGVHSSQRRNRSVQTAGYQAVLRDRPFLLLIVANTCFALCSNFIYLAIPIYFTVALKMPIWFIGIALAFNTILNATMQTLVVRWLEPFRRTRALVAAGGFWGVWCLTSALAFFLPRFLLIPYLLVVVCVYGVAQMMHTPASNALSALSSPEGLRGRYLAAFQYSFFVAGIIGPSMFTSLFTIHPDLPWLVMACIAVAGGLVVYRIESHLPERALWVKEQVAEPTASATIDEV